MYILRAQSCEILKSSTNNFSSEKEIIFSDRTKTDIEVWSRDYKFLKFKSRYLSIYKLKAIEKARNSFFYFFSHIYFIPTLNFRITLL